MKKREPQIAHIITGLGIGGAEMVLLNLATASRKIGHLPLIIALVNEKGLLPEFTKRDIDVVFLDLKNSPLSLLRSLIHCKRLLVQRQIDIVHAHMFHAAFFSIILKYFFKKVKLVYTSHSFNIGSKFREIIMWAFKPFRDHDIIFSPSMKNFTYKSKACTVIPNGVDMSCFVTAKVTKEPVFTFVNVARLEHVKNQEILIKAVHYLSQKGRNIHLWLIGVGEDREKLETMTIEMGLTNRISFLGKRSDIPSLLLKSHCFVLCSKWEGLPLAIIEAVAAKLPVISTPVGSIPDFFSPGMIRYAHDEEIAIAMDDIVENYSDYVSKTEEVYTFAVNNFDISNICRQHFAIYCQLNAALSSNEN